MNVRDLLNGVAIGLDATADALKKDGKHTPESGVAMGAAVVLRTVAELLTDRTPAECVAILEAIRDKGTKAISDVELDAQTKAVIDRANRG